MNLDYVETILRWLGGILAYGALILLFWGILRGQRRLTGRINGRASGWLHSVIFYLLASLIFFGGSILGWEPLPFNISAQLRPWLLVCGSLLFFTGLALVLWGRFTLGQDYFVSTALGAQVFKNQRLITHGPFAIVRHPMYLGLILAAWGSLFLYHTWTGLLYAVFAPCLFLRACREESVLAQEFGEQWQAYCRQVPAIFPRLSKKH